MLITNTVHLADVAATIAAFVVLTRSHSSSDAEEEDGGEDCGHVNSSMNSKDSMESQLATVGSQVRNRREKQIEEKLRRAREAAFQNRQAATVIAGLIGAKHPDEILEKAQKRFRAVS